MVCPVCRSRSARRSCPALGQEICPVCCGTKRLVEIRCPDSCAYLSSAKAHPPSSVRKQQAQDASALAPAMAGLTEPQQQLVLFTLTLVARFRGAGLDAAEDADVAEATRAMAATYETAARGLIYEERPSSGAAQRLAAEIRAVYEQVGRERPSAFAADAAVALRRLNERIQAVRQAPGSGPRAFLELASRVARMLKPDAGSADAPGASPSAEPARSSLILP